MVRDCSVNNYYDNCHHKNVFQGIDKISEEREEREQPLIDPLHGHGRLSRIILLL